MTAENSRYASVETAECKRADGVTIRYLRRRFLPPPNQSITFVEHVVTGGDRLDNVTARYLTDPLLFWRVADANNAMHPAELTSQEAVNYGRRLKIPFPTGG